MKSSILSSTSRPRVFALLCFLATALAKPTTQHLTDAPVSLSNDVDRLANCSGGSGDDMRLHQVTHKEVEVGRPTTRPTSHVLGVSLVTLHASRSRDV